LDLGVFEELFQRPQAADPGHHAALNVLLGFRGQHRLACRQGAAGSFVQDHAGQAPGPGTVLFRGAVAVGVGFQAPGDFGPDHSHRFLELLLVEGQRTSSTWSVPAVSVREFRVSAQLRAARMRGRRWTRAASPWPVRKRAALGSRGRRAHTGSPTTPLISVSLPRAPTTASPTWGPARNSHGVVSLTRLSWAMSPEHTTMARSAASNRPVEVPC